MIADYLQHFSQNSINTICQSTVLWWFAIHGPNVGHFLSDGSLGKLLFTFAINSRNVCVCFLNFSLVLCDLFLSVLEYNLKEIAYDANVAQLGWVR